MGFDKLAYAFSMSHQIVFPPPIGMVSPRRIDIREG